MTRRMYASSLIVLVGGLVAFLDTSQVVWLIVALAGVVMLAGLVWHYKTYPRRTL